ncbi:XkdX family protein [Bacillus paralicheniformis]|uniref:XkdX family protein n=1 Tax=Bacillus paralicheniformis TaxID=1648923 RepID=UPI0034D2005B
MDLNFWVYALFYNWADTAMVKRALQYNDVTVEELKEGVDRGFVTSEQYEEITGEPYPAEEA